MNITCSWSSYKNSEIKMILTECIEAPTALDRHFVYETVKEVCVNLKPGVSRGFDQVTYKHLKYGGLKLWSILSILYFRVFYLIEVSQSLKFELRSDKSHHVTLP